MPWTNAWDETKPADSDLANTLGIQGRQVKLDIRERLNAQHIFGQSTSNDGEHRNIVQTSNGIAANQEAYKLTGFSLTGANAQAILDLAGTWNTSGVPTAIKLNATDTASGAASLLLDLQVSTVSKFSIRKDGRVSMLGATLSRPQLSNYTEDLNAAGNITGATTIDWSLGHFSGVLTGNVTFSFTNVPATGKTVGILVKLKQDGTGSRTVTWPGAVIGASGSLPVMTATAGKADWFLLLTIDGGTTVYIFPNGQGFAS